MDTLSGLLDASKGLYTQVVLVSDEVGLIDNHDPSTALPVLLSIILGADTRATSSSKIKITRREDENLKAPKNRTGSRTIIIHMRLVDLFLYTYRYLHYFFFKKKQLIITNLP